MKCILCFCFHPCFYILCNGVYYLCSKPGTPLIRIHKVSLLSACDVVESTPWAMRHSLADFTECKQFHWGRSSHSVNTDLRPPICLWDNVDSQSPCRFRKYRLCLSLLSRSRHDREPTIQTQAGHVFDVGRSRTADRVQVFFLRFEVKVNSEVADAGKN